MISSKKDVQILASLLLKANITDIVISPGSRNAPLINTFDNLSRFRCFNIVDERSAAFFALGLALKNKRPVVIICTSGSAMLNYAPAVAEAYYQNVPLLIISADRPLAVIDQGEGQTIRQTGALSNIVNKWVSLTGGMRDEDEIWFNTRKMNEAIGALTTPQCGPVHMNMPFSEPLYELEDKNLPEIESIKTIHNYSTLLDSQVLSLKEEWNSATKKLILVGQQQPDRNLEKILRQLSLREDVAILSETTSNIKGDQIHTSIDNIVFPLEGSDTNLSPDLLITMGGEIVSKKVKAWLRSHKPEKHWHIGQTVEFKDTFRVLTSNIVCDPSELFAQMLLTVQLKSDYSAIWSEIDETTRKAHYDYLSQQSFCDFKVFELIMQRIANGSVLHLSNSTAVRYAQLFPMKELVYQSNRGVSGIDGSTSTAAGYAHDCKEQNVLVTGDLAFFYDSNALWNKHLPSNLKIILINNSGGGIFRFIDGPASMPSSEEHFVAQHHTKAKQLAATYGVEYNNANCLETLNQNLDWLLNTEGCAILEVFTPPELNATVLRDYFKHLKQIVVEICS